MTRRPERRPRACKSESKRGATVELNRVLELLSQAETLLKQQPRTGRLEEAMTHLGEARWWVRAEQICRYQQAVVPAHSERGSSE